MPDRWFVGGIIAGLFYIASMFSIMFESTYAWQPEILATGYAVFVMYFLAVGARWLSVDA